MGVDPLGLVEGLVPVGYKVLGALSGTAAYGPFVDDTVDRVLGLFCGEYRRRWWRVAVGEAGRVIGMVGF